MNINELNVKDYIRKQTTNTAFTGKEKKFFIHIKKCYKSNCLSFDEIYKLYNDFKKLGKQLFIEQDGKIHKIEILDDKLSIKWPLIIKSTLSERENIHLTNFLTSKYSFDNNDIGLNQISLSDILNFSELIYLCSDSIKSFVKGLNNYNKSEIQIAEKKFSRIIAIYENEVEQSFQSSNLQRIPENYLVLLYYL